MNRVHEKIDGYVPVPVRHRATELDRIFLSHEDVEVIAKFKVSRRQRSMIGMSVFDNLDTVLSQQVEESRRISYARDSMDGRARKTLNWPHQ